MSGTAERGLQGSAGDSRDQDGRCLCLREDGGSTPSSGDVPRIQHSSWQAGANLVNVGRTVAHVLSAYCMQGAEWGERRQREGTVVLVQARAPALDSEPQCPHLRSGGNN